MRISKSAVFMGCLLLGIAACQSSTVRGPQGQSLTVTTVTSMTMHRGHSAPLEVGIDREKFTGPVTVSIFQLPNGVGSDKASIQAETTSATFILTASKLADLVSNQAVGVSVEGPDGRKATQFVNLTVTD
jgi:ABC-type glycerol-3-phosphate transport system substrate-binding protein